MTNTKLAVSRGASQERKQIALGCKFSDGIVTGIDDVDLAGLCEGNGGHCHVCGKVEQSRHGIATQTIGAILSGDAGYIAENAAAATGVFVNNLFFDLVEFLESWCKITG